MSSVSALQKPRSAELLDLLLEQGILHRSETQPVLSRDGTSARWMLDSLAVTLQPHGAELAGQLVLEKLRNFDGRQLATFGLTAVPILQSIVLQSDAGHWGLLVRPEPKAHGSKKRIEGKIDLDEPVIMIEDSIASGTNVSQGIATLEAAGLRVEGCIALVRFGWEGGVSDLQARGYHVEAVYDIFEDFMSRMEGEEAPNHNPTKMFPEIRWSARRAPDGMHPAHLARAVLREFCSTGEVLLPPLTLDRADYDCSGGAWVSLRSREDIFDRYAREGFWHFPEELSWGPAEDVVRAAFLTAGALPVDADRNRLIDSSYVAVTFFSALSKVTVGELDNERYGIVVASGERAEVMGGALPRMPGIRDEWQQFRHARFNNAGLDEFEPYILYRHEVSKFVEPGALWQTSGVAGSDGVPDCGSLASWTRNVVRGSEIRESLVLPALPAGTKQIFVTVYIDGEVRGCMGSEISDLEQDLRTLAQAALHDERFPEIALEPDSEVAVSISLLCNELVMGDFSPHEVQYRYRHGQQALAVEQDERQGLMLPFVSTWLCLDAEDFVAEVIDKAGITREPYEWRRFDCATWLSDEAGTCRLEGGFKRCSPTASVDGIAGLQCGYLERNLQSDGLLYFGYHPFQNTLYQGIDMARQAHAAWTFVRLGRRDNAQLALHCALGLSTDPALELSRDAFALLTMCAGSMLESDECARLVSKLLRSMDRHGRVVTWQPTVNTNENDKFDDLVEHDQVEENFDAEELENYVPGQVLLALAAAAGGGLLPVEQPLIQRAFRYYRHRFRYKRDFGQVSWITLAAAAWARMNGHKELAELVFEIADFILQFQQKKSGAFITDHQPDTPGYTTAVYLEAIGAAYHVALRFNPPRAARYDDAWHEGFNFLDRLIIQQRDFSVLPNGDYALGGLRENLYSSHVRIDFVQHSLAAIVERYPHIAVTPFSDEDHHG